MSSNDVPSKNGSAQMLMNIPKAPSFWGIPVTGLLILIMIILVIRNYNELRSLDSYRLLMVYGMFTLVAGVHSMLHLGAESVYRWNPLA